MSTAPTLTGMQKHVLDHLDEVVMHADKKSTRYDLRGREVNAQIASLIAKKLIAQDRSGQLSVC